MANGLPVACQADGRLVQGGHEGCAACISLFVAIGWPIDCVTAFRQKKGRFFSGRYGFSRQDCTEAGQNTVKWQAPMACEGGEIGRRTRFRFLRLRCKGSSPFSRTNLVPDPKRKRQPRAAFLLSTAVHVHAKIPHLKTSFLSQIFFP